MDEAVIRKVKEIVIKRKIAENEGDGNQIEHIEKKIDELQHKVEGKIASIEEKIDLILQRMQ